MMVSTFKRGFVVGTAGVVAAALSAAGPAVGIGIAPAFAADPVLVEHTHEVSEPGQGFWTVPAGATEITATLAGASGEDDFFREAPAALAVS
ncbi:hypothetical protein [Paramicrobacterium fandaimingii]|uniref:hypothetical protein n=1 Tax=Paramicrobacterium fandaimingii TaxID=2708079 RepID=UPI0014212648|nr:hypothetical protein [Microbacterium fandaimingii]